MRLLLLACVLIAISVQNAQSQVRVSHTVIDTGSRGSRFNGPSSLARVPVHRPFIPSHPIRPIRPILPVRPFGSGLHRVPSHPIYRRPYRRSVTHHRLQKRGLSVAQGVVLGAIGGAIVTKKVIKGVKKLGVLKKVHHHHHFGRKRRSTNWIDQLAAQYEPLRQMQNVVQNVQKRLPLRSERLRFQLARFPAAFTAATGIRLPDFFIETSNVKQQQQASFDSSNQAAASLSNSPGLVNRILHNQSPIQSYKWTPPTTVEFVPNRNPGSNSPLLNPAADILSTNNNNNNSPSFDSPLRPISSDSDRIAYIVAENPSDLVANNAPEVSDSVRKEIESNKALDPTEEPLPVTTEPLQSESLPEANSPSFSNTGSESNIDSVSSNNSSNSPSADNFK